MDSSDSKIQKRMDKVEDSLGGNIRAVSEDLEELKRRVEKNEDGLDSRIETVINKMSSGQGPRPPPGGTVRPRPLSRPSDLGARPAASDDVRRQEQYWKARRSIRLWPVKGLDLRLALSIFLTDELKMDPDICEEINSYEVRRVRSA